jgi:hypothetical protein
MPKAAGFLPGFCLIPGVLRASDPLPLNRRSDRQLNNALHTIAVVRLRDDP